MEAELERSFEALLNGLAEARLGVQPRHLIFVLIGHQPEERSCDRPRELVAVWKDGRFRRARALHNVGIARSEEHTSELQSLMSISYAVFCLKKKKTTLQ